MAKTCEHYQEFGLDELYARYFADGRKRIVAVSAAPDFTLLLSFSNGEHRLLDCKPFIEPGTVFSFLADPQSFSRVYLDENHAVAWDIDPASDSTAVWGNKIDLSPDTCYVESVPVV